MEYKSKTDSASTAKREDLMTTATSRGSHQEEEMEYEME